MKYTLVYVLLHLKYFGIFKSILKCIVVYFFFIQIVTVKKKKKKKKNFFVKINFFWVIF